MERDGPNWKGLFKWSLAHSDGTGSPRNLGEEDRRWFIEAMQAQCVDVTKRLKEITMVMQAPESVLEAQGVTPADIEDLLEELQEHVECIDAANDLHSIGGLVPVLGYLRNSHANIRAKAAEVVTTVVQNNPSGQQFVMEAKGLEPLMSNFLSDPDATVRTKSLGTISSLIRNNKAGAYAFRLANGYAGLRDALGSDCARFQRKALNLIHYLLEESASDCSVATQLGFPRIMLHLASSEDAEVREASMRGLLDLARHNTDRNGARSGEEGERLRRLLEERIEWIRLTASSSPEDLCAARDERQLVDSLWNACFHEPSSLRENGLLVLAGENSLPPLVADIQHLEPPRETCAADPSSPDKYSSAKAKPPPPPLLLLSGSSSPPENLL